MIQILNKNGLVPVQCVQVPGAIQCPFDVILLSMTTKRCMGDVEF